MSSYLDELAEQRRRGQSEEASEGYQEHYSWYEACDDDSEYVEKQRAGSLLAQAQALDTAQREAHEQNLWAAQLYSNRELAAFDWGTGQLSRASLAPISRTGENITVRVVDTLVAQIGKNRPKPKPVARGATFSLRKQIKRLDKYLYGEFQRNRLYAKTKLAFRDACIFGFGAVKITVEDGDDGARVCYERVFPDEILVDQLEIVACGKIRHFYRRRVLPIEVIQSTYGLTEEQAEKLEEAASSYTYLDYRPVGKGWAVVVEGYQLAAGEDSPGRWMVATTDMVLDEGEWPHDFLPYVFFHWQQPLAGFYSPSVVEQVLPYQIRLNEINEVIRDAQDLMGRPRVLVAEGSKVNPLEVDNTIGRFIKYTGIKPEAITWPAINAELYNERDRLVRTCLEQFGVSQMAATATPPAAARFDSSAAFREFNAIQDDRLSDPAQRFEEFHLDLAERTIQVIGASKKSPKTVWYSGWKRSKAEEIDWKSIDLDQNAFTMTMEATSIFSMSPAAARDELEKNLAMGLITPEQYRLEVSDLDTEAVYSLAAAAKDDLNRVQELLEDGEWENPIPEQDLVGGIEQMTLAMLQLMKYPDFPEETKLNFVNWITLARELAERGTDDSGTLPEDAMAAQDMGPAQGGPMGMPASVPVPEAMGLAPAGPGPMPNIQ